MTSPEPEAKNDIHIQNENSSPSFKKIALISTAIIASLVAVFVGISWLGSKSAPRPTSIEIVDQDLDLDLDSNEPVQSPWKNAALELLTRFLEAESGEERKKYVQGSEMFTEELEQGLLLDELNIDGFFPANITNQDLPRNIVGLTYETPEAYRFKKMFVPILPVELTHVQSDLLPLQLQTAADAEQFLDKSVKISAYFKKTNDTLKLDWPVFAQSLYDFLDSFVSSDVVQDEEVFRLGLAKDIVIQAVDPDPTLAAYRIFDLSDPHKSYRVLILDPVILKTLESRWEERNLNAETITIRLQKKDGHLILKEIICWEFLGLGGQRLKE